MSGFVASAIGALREYVGAAAWSPLVRISRAGVLSVLHRVQLGCLILVEEDGTEIRCGGTPGPHICTTEPRTELRIKSDAFWVRLALFADMVRL